MIMMEDSNGMREILQTHSSADFWGAAHHSSDDLSQWWKTRYPNELLTKEDIDGDSTDLSCA